MRWATSAPTIYLDLACGVSTALAVLNLVNFAALQANAANGAYGVQVMNLWTDSNGTGYAQDQLVLVPDGGTTLTLLGLAFGGMALFSRRVRRA